MEKSQIKEFLKNARKTAVIGIGSELRADDWVGCLISEGLRTKKAQVYTSETTPENFVFASDCSHVILIDAAHLSKPPGSVGYFQDPSIIGETNTHKATTLLMKYLKNSGCMTLLIAIEPENLEFGGKMSQAVKKAAERVKKELEDALN